MSAEHLLPARPGALADLALFVARAARADPGGAARLRADGGVLAVLVCPVRGAGAPLVLGVRSLALAEPAALDATVELAALADRLAREPSSLAVPPVEVPGQAWAGVVPPRSGWTPTEHPGPPDVLEAALAGARLLGFVDGAGTRTGTAGPWLRLATARGDVLARRPLLG